MHAVEALGNQELDRLAEELLARVAEQGLRLEVGELDQAVAVNDDHRVGGGFDQPLSVLDAEGRLAIGPRAERATLSRVLGVGADHSSSPSACGSDLLSSSISFFSSIILSSRPTVSLWNRSSSSSLSSSLVRCEASVSACFCAVTSRAAANTPRWLVFFLPSVLAIRAEA